LRANVRAVPDVFVKIASAVISVTASLIPLLSKGYTAVKIAAGSVSGRFGAMAATSRSHAVNQVTFRCHGHPRITGSHTKTIELTRDADVTARATCVIGVASEHDDRELLRLRGEVEVTVECGPARDTFRSVISPFFIGDDALVFRRGQELRGRTLGFDATKTAAELDRDLVRAAAHREAVVTVTIRELGKGDRRGALFVVSVPIGNDDDLSPRARRVLEAADVVLAEDTRRFRDLAARTRMDVEARVISYHDHNESERAEAALEQLAGGGRIALVSDAGTPLFSDPGYVVVRRAADAGFAVSPVPGPSSLLAVLSASGLPVDRFTYAGFLARRSAARRSEIAALAAAGDAFVVHEAPRRVHGLLADMAAVVPEWRLCIGREVTKVFEEFLRGSAAELAGGFAAADEDARGEFTVVAAPPEHVRSDQDDATVGAGDENLDRLVRALLAQGVTPKTVAKALSELPGISHKQAYTRVLEIARQR
jgi:16S rRNA (cytidine1402-2'-O)-methyltransferase